MTCEPSRLSLHRWMPRLGRWLRSGQALGPRLWSACPAWLWPWLLVFPTRRVVRRQIAAAFPPAGHPLRLLFPAPSVPWNVMVQRPQQLARAFARCGAAVLYATDNYAHLPDRSVRGLKRIADRLYLFNDGAHGQTLDALPQALVWQYWAFQTPFTRALPACRARVYDWLDDVAVHGYDAHLLREHDRLLAESDLVVVTADRLREQAARRRDDVLLLPNGVDFDFFARPRHRPWPRLDALTRTGRPIIGFYGSFLHRFDYRLMAYAARRHPDWLFLLVGASVEPALWRRSRLDALDNVVYWPPLPYDRLPHLVARFTVATIPFRLNPVTLATSPVKLFEYMAAAKPVVTTDLPECRRYPGVLVAHSPAEFDLKLQQAVALAADPDYTRRLQQQAQAHSWTARARTALAELHRRGLIDRLPADLALPAGRQAPPASSPAPNAP